MGNNPTDRAGFALAAMVLRALSVFGLIAVPIGIATVFWGPDFLRFDTETSAWLGLALVCLSLAYAHTMRIFAIEAELAHWEGMAKPERDA